MVVWKKSSEKSRPKYARDTVHSVWFVYECDWVIWLLVTCRPRMVLFSLTGRLCTSVPSKIASTRTRRSTVSINRSDQLYKIQIKFITRARSHRNVNLRRKTLSAIQSRLTINQWRSTVTISQWRRRQWSLPSYSLWASTTNISTSNNKMCNRMTAMAIIQSYKYIKWTANLDI